VQRPPGLAGILGPLPLVPAVRQHRSWRVAEQRSTLQERPAFRYRGVNGCAQVVQYALRLVRRLTSFAQVLQEPAGLGQNAVRRVAVLRREVGQTVADFSELLGKALQLVLGPVGDRGLSDVLCEVGVTDTAV
jgi:hypothetical protein